MKLLQSLILKEDPDTSFKSLDPENQARVMENWEALMAALKKDCSQYLGVVSEEWCLLRGAYDYSYAPEIEVHQIRRDRYPSATSTEITDAVNAAMSQKVGFKPRTQALFVTLDEQQAGIYGQPFMIFPVGDFSIAYLEGVRDLYSLISGYMSQEERDNEAFTSSLREVIYELLALFPEEHDDVPVDNLMGQIYGADRTSPAKRNNLQLAVAENGGMDQTFADLFTMWIPDHVKVTHNEIPHELHVELMMDCVQGFYAVPLKEVADVFGDVSTFLRKIKNETTTSV